MGIVGNLLVAVDEGKVGQFQGRNYRDTNLQGKNTFLYVIYVILFKGHINA